MGFFAHFRGCKYQDAEWQVDSREDTQIDGRSTRLGTDSPQKQRPAYNLEIRRREDDRTAWGSYMESAPPVLPADTCIPGFEDEILLAARRQYSECNSDGGDSKDGSGGEGLDDGGGRRSGSVTDDAFDAPTRRTRDIFRLPFSSNFEASSWSAAVLPTILSFHGNPSSLFGSTTRPAAATTSHRLILNGDNEGTSSRRSSIARMAPKTHLWISLWFLLTAPVIFWDAGYCFMR